MTKRKKPLTCKICGKKFSYSAKVNPIARLNKHRWKEHPTQAKRSLKKGQKAKTKLQSEMELTDDLLLKQIEQLKQQYSPRQPYEPEHNVAVGTLIQGVMLGVEIAQGIQKGVKFVKKARKK